MVWAIDMDDFHGICGEENALLKVLHRNMKNYKVPTPTITTTPRPEWARPKSTTSSPEYPVQLDETTRKPLTTKGTSKPKPPTKRTTKKRVTTTRKPIKETEETTTMRRSTRPLYSTTEENVIDNEQEVIENTNNEIDEIEEAEVTDHIENYDCSEPESDFLTHNDCDKYVRCVHGTVYVMPCRPDTVFHTVENVCVWPVDSDREKCRISQELKK